MKSRERRKFQIWYQAQHPIDHYSQIHKIQCGERIGGTHHQVRDVKRASTTQANLGNFACIKHFVTFVKERVEIIAIRIKRTQIHFLRDVFTTVAVLVS